jgi:hypothetical protein
MSAAMEMIQQIRALREENRNPRLSAATTKSVETIIQSIQSHSDQGGWGKVNWRGPAYRDGKSSAPASNGGGSSRSHQGGAPRGGASSHASSHSSSHSSSHASSHASSRQSRPSTSTGAHGNVFQHRNRAPYPSRESQPSIPLICSSASISSASSSTASSVDGDGFEVVRRDRRRQDGVSSVSFASSGSASSGSGSSGSSGSGSGFASSEFRGPPQKYVSKFKRTTEKVEDTILNTILLGKLNKFSAANYDDIKEFITQIISSGQTEMMSCFMKLVFEKAASEEIFCPLYAKLLSELSAQYPILLQEMASLYTHYMNIFVEVSDEPDKNHQDFCQRNVEKKYRRGYSQFLAELTKHNVIDTEVFVQTVLKIVEQIELNQANPSAVKMVEELADCLVRMMKAIQAEMMRQEETDEKDEKSNHAIKVSRIRSTLKGEVSVRIQPLTVRRPEAVGLSNKARFTFMDIYDGIQKFSV